jgi:hypothetical protein
MIFSSLPAELAFFLFGLLALNHLTGCILPFFSSAVKSFFFLQLFFFLLDKAAADTLIDAIYMPIFAMFENNCKSLNVLKNLDFQTAAGWTLRSTTSSDS